MQVIDPSTGERGKSYEPHSDADVEAKLARAARAFETWAARSIDDRTAILSKAAAILRERSGALAALMAHEMGKPVAQGRAEAEKCAACCEYYAENARAFLAPDIVKTDARESFVAYEPLGPVLAIMPWNFPFWQAFRHIAPSLAAGNVILLKHAENVPGCAIEIETILRDAGADEGVFTTLLVDRDRAGAVLRDPRIAAATLTGSTRAGRSVGGTAGERLKKSVLELGGSDAYLVLEDADLDLAADTCAKSRLINSGQSCIAAKRFIAVERVREAFTERFVEKMRAARVGDPRREETEVGPQAREDLREELHRQVERTLAKGARALLGCELPEGRGYFYPPSVLAGVTPGMPAFDEELAIALAYRSVFGLGAAVFTRDLARGRSIAQHRLRAGSCFVNGLVRSDPRLPFGGIKESGYGRELARHGMVEFVNIKTVYVA
jgi:succinate-semialdehyde dehydrogenase/glutarate-semialdehyde dehydrogenase